MSLVALDESDVVGHDSVAWLCPATRDCTRHSSQTWLTSATSGCVDTGTASSQSINHPKL